MTNVCSWILEFKKHIAFFAENARAKIIKACIKINWNLLLWPGDLIFANVPHF